MGVALGAAIRKRRQELGLTLRQLAADMDVSAAYLHDVEVGRRGMRPQTLEACAASLLLEPEALYSLTEWNPQFLSWLRSRPSLLRSLQREWQQDVLGPAQHIKERGQNAFEGRGQAATAGGRSADAEAQSEHQDRRQSQR